MLAKLDAIGVGTSREWWESAYLCGYKTGLETGWGPVRLMHVLYGGRAASTSKTAGRARFSGFGATAAECLRNEPEAGSFSNWRLGGLKLVRLRVQWG